MSLILCILNEILYGTTCTTGNKYKVGSIILTVFNFVFQVMALTSIIDYYRRLRFQFRGTPTLRKFLTYKIMVWLIIHQSLILEIVEFAQVVTPTSGTTANMSYADFKYGIPQFMLCCETLVFSCLFVWAFSACPYRRALKSRDFEIPRVSHSPDASVRDYILALVYPKDIFHEILQGSKTFLGLFRGAKDFDYTAGTGVGFNERFYKKEVSPLGGDRSQELPIWGSGEEQTYG